MKKSEAIKKLLSLMRETIDCDNGIYEIDAETVLQCVEDLGMMPPYVSAAESDSHYLWESE
jgi:hypothetical protein